MTSKAGAGRDELQPDTVSYNCMLDTLAYSRDSQAPYKAEALLEKMDEMGADCRPDIYSFNCVLNAWSRSRNRNARSRDRDQCAADRADAILRHMEERYSSGKTAVQPDSLSYHAVLSAFARSKNQESVETLLKRMKKAFENGNTLAQPTTVTYNILISAIPSPERALKLLESMKTMGKACQPDCVTYTTIMGILAKRSDNADIKSIELLNELESMYNKTGDQSLKPTIKTYTTVRLYRKAIWHSHKSLSWISLRSFSPGHPRDCSKR